MSDVRMPLIKGKEHNHPLSLVTQKRQGHIKSRGQLIHTSSLPLKYASSACNTYYCAISKQQFLETVGGICTSILLISKHFTAAAFEF